MGRNRDSARSGVGVEIMLLKNHVTIGRVYFDGPEQFEALLLMHQDNPKIRREDFTDASEAEIAEYLERVVKTNTRPAPSARTTLRKAKRSATAQAHHWDMMGDATQAAAWRSYYRELFALEQAPGWPILGQWPTPPDGAE